MAGKGYTLDFDLGAFEGRAEALARDAMARTALQGESIVKVRLSQPGSGKEYSRGKTAVHKASAPGEPPAPDTGRLRASTTHEVVVSGSRIIARVTVNTDYALALELGTERIAPRPFLRPSTPEIYDLAGDELKRAFGRL